MKSWKQVLGIGAACAACCAVPLLGGVAALTTGMTALAAVGSALMACADELLPFAMVLFVLAAIGGGLAWWRRRALRLSQPGLGCAGKCHAGQC
jgi:hypothetical protein